MAANPQDGQNNELFDAPEKDGGEDSKAEKVVRKRAPKKTTEEKAVEAPKHAAGEKPTRGRPPKSHAIEAEKRAEEKAPKSEERPEIKSNSHDKHEEIKEVKSHAQPKPEEIKEAKPHVHAKPEAVKENKTAEPVVQNNKTAEAPPPRPAFKDNPPQTDKHSPSQPRHSGSSYGGSQGGYNRNYQGSSSHSSHSHGHSSPHHNNNNSGGNTGNNNNSGNSGNTGNNNNSGGNGNNYNNSNNYNNNANNPNTGASANYQSLQNQQFQQHQYVEAKGFTIKDLKDRTAEDLLKLTVELNINLGHLKPRKGNLIMRIMHEQIKKAGGYAAEGVLDILEDGYGFLRTASYSMNEKDVYVSPSQIRRFDLRTGDVIIGQTRAPKEGEKFAALLRIEAINFDEPEKVKTRKSFDNLIPYYPTEKFLMENAKPQSDLSTRIIDLMSPVGKGQRGLIVAPPKAGKTTLLKYIANSIIENHPEVELMILLIDERPEEVTDMQRSVDVEVISSTFDEPLEHHIKVSELTLEKAKRLVENDKHVVILLDSITRLARAYNLQIPSSGQTLTGGVNPAALYKPKKFFGAARNIEGSGSLTILATALVETGSKLDDIIFEEFKGTGNMELVLDRKLFEKRLFPCIDIKRTGTRKEELLLNKETLNKVWILRKILEPLSPSEAMQLLIDRMSKTKNNKDFLESMRIADAN